MQRRLILLSALLWHFCAMAEPTLPASPPNFVMDEALVVSPETLNKLNQLFSAQEKRTGEQIVFVIFKSLSDQNLEAWTNRIFSAWKIGQKGKDNGVLLALYWEDHKARIEVGYGLEPLLTDAKAKGVLNEILIPELKRNHPDAALKRSAFEILTVLQSPLVADGTAQKILDQKNTQDPDEQDLPLGALIGLVMIFGFIGLAIAWRARQGPRGGGGGFYGGGYHSGGGSSGSSSGGFSGGGGSSGGGGASGSW